ncbi:EscU/YscU/HrcU family type III secretion system export apparatus switch protein [Halonatronum saccharophilum]|uniref:EscU/YscU/HrcU family type III secretion system export apparatus switch protein n=1 Tax=Halonatronum saccharophilum TaxID=150060 RepID=UPI0004838A71|nr:EscU/YscU/HrcU family type III secretion system export apparatus switch protein [Halonatronum saccharophilum]
MKKNNDKKDLLGEAAALKYNSKEDSAPTLIAKGRGELAQRIIEKAKEEDIPIESDKDLIKLLLKLEVGEEIPEDLYQAVAHILSFIYELEDLI